MQVPVVPGLTWRFPLADGIMVTSAQLQHRLPCWGYVLQETLPAAVVSTATSVDSTPAAARGPGRKVVLLGDTCGSEAIAGAWKAGACTPPTDVHDLPGETLSSIGSTLSHTSHYVTSLFFITT